MNDKKTRLHGRRGTIVILVALMIVPLFAMVAFSVDYGYLAKVRSDLQRAADAAALAAVQDLVPATDGTQDLQSVRDSVRAYVALNTNASFQVSNSDIEIGRYDPATIYSYVSLLQDGTFDTVRVTLRRDASANSPVSLTFAPVLGIRESDIVVTATAALVKPMQMRPGADVIPFTIPKDLWDGLAPGEGFVIYGDGKVEDAGGNNVPGNWGTCDIGPSNNSTSDLRDQILDGLRQSDLDALQNDGRIPTNTHIDSTQPVWLNGDPGLSSGMKSAVQQIHGQERIAPICDANNGQGGNNLEYHVVEWGVVNVVDSNWKGSKNTYISVTKSHIYDGDLGTDGDLSRISGSIEGAFGSPTLIE